MLRCWLHPIDSQMEAGPAGEAGEAQVLPPLCAQCGSTQDLSADESGVLYCINCWQQHAAEMVPSAEAASTPRRATEMAPSAEAAGTPLQCTQCGAMEELTIDSESGHYYCAACWDGWSEWPPAANADDESTVAECQVCD